MINYAGNNADLRAVTDCYNESFGILTGLSDFGLKKPAMKATIRHWQTIVENAGFVTELTVQRLQSEGAALQQIIEEFKKNRQRTVGLSLDDQTAISEAQSALETSLLLLIVLEARPEPAPAPPMPLPPSDDLLDRLRKHIKGKSCCEIICGFFKLSTGSKKEVAGGPQPQR